MSGSHKPSVSVPLRQLRDGDSGALNRLWPLVDDELRRLARGLLRRERPDHSVQATALVHEAYLALVEQRTANWQDRAHFLGVAALVMRRFLRDYARRRNAQKRGGQAQRVTLNDDRLGGRPDVDVLRIDEALTRLAQLSERQARVVELRVFGGLTEEEVAEVVGVTRRTVTRDWVAARAWLSAELKA